MKKNVQQAGVLAVLLALGHPIILPEAITVRAGSVPAGALMRMGGEAADLVISGTVTDEKGEALPGVSVILKGTSKGTNTDAKGAFRLNVPDKNAVLTFSYVGFISQEVVVGNKTAVNITMLADAKILSEVVVVGYGTLQKKDMTGAVSQIKASRLENENPNTVQDMVRGNAAGIGVTFDATAKGGGDLQVRGRNSLNASTSPLLVVDGVIYYGALSDINPNDIETIDVLKDASSAAVFGAKAASGVVLITTKKGKGDKAQINFDVSSGLSTLAQKQPVWSPEGYVNWREDLLYATNANAKPYQFSDPRTLPANITQQQWLAYDGASGDPTEVWLRRLKLQPVEIENYKAGRTINWYDKVFQTAKRQDYNVSLSGKKNDVTYYWSLGYLNNQGVVVGDKFSNLRSRLNLEGKVNSFLTVGVNTQFADRDESQVPADWTQIYLSSPYGSEYNADGTLRWSPQDDQGGGSKNPYLAMTYTDRLKKYNTLISSLYAKIALPYGFSFQSTFSPRFEWYRYFNAQSSKSPEWASTGGSAQRDNSMTYYWQVDNILKWNKTFNAVHQFDVTLLANAEKFQSWSNSMSNSSFAPNDNLGYHNIGAGVKPVMSSNDEYSTGDALMARLFYSFRDRYMLTTSVRRDGYSAFGQANPRATFPSVALGWIFSDEPFIKNAGLSWLNYGKVRASWGVNGNRDIGRYEALSNLSTGKYLLVRPDGTVYQVSQLYVDRMSNPQLKWEKTTAYNFGLDFALFNNIIDGSLELYKTSTKDLLVKRTLPDILGFSFVWDNLGEVQNKGIELNLNAKVLNSKNFSWRTSGNFSLNRNKIVHLYGDNVNVTDASGNVVGQREADDITNKWFIGRSIDEIWDLKVLGIWQTNEADEAAKYGMKPGDFKVQDVNGDFKYTNEDRQFLGYTSPRFQWNWRNEFRLFNMFDVSMLMYSYWGQMSSFNQAKNQGFFDRVTGYSLPYWTAENPINDYARLSSSNGSANYSVYRKKSFIRLSTVSVAYNLPKPLLQRLKIQNAKAYINVQNLGVFAPNWNFWDPEASKRASDPDNYTSGPTPRNFTLGLNLTL